MSPIRHDGEARSDNPAASPMTGRGKRPMNSSATGPVRATENGSVMAQEHAAPGILVMGDNHLIVRGPFPDRSTALALAQHWSLIEIGKTTPPTLAAWSISTKEFRENLQWAVIVPGDGEISPAIAQLLAELSERGITIHDSRTSNW